MKPEDAKSLMYTAQANYWRAKEELVRLEIKFKSFGKIQNKDLGEDVKFTGTATIKQRDFIKSLGGDCPDHLDKQEAGFMIEELKSRKEKDRIRAGSPVTSELMDKVEEDYNNSFEQESKPLTQEEIDEIGEEALF